MDVIVLDHHEPKAQLPDCVAIVNPKLTECRLRISLQCRDRLQTLSRATKDAAAARIRFEIKARSCGARHCRRHRAAAWREPCSGATWRNRDRADLAHRLEEINANRRSAPANFARRHWLPAWAAIECCGAFEHGGEIFATAAYAGRKRSNNARSGAGSAKSRTSGSGNTNLCRSDREDRQ